MDNYVRFLILLFALAWTSSAVGATQTRTAQTITIGTGGATGVYYPLGATLCSLVNRDFSQHGIRCLVNETSGSVYNLKAIRSGAMDIGLVQSDQLYNAYRGIGAFAEDGSNQDLRTLFTTHSEPFTVLARAGSGITTFDDLKGKRVSIGNLGSGQRAIMETLMQTKGWTLDMFAEALALPPVEQSRALCDNQVDAIVYTVGHPNRSILEATIACDAVLVEVAGAKVDELIKTNPYYTHTTIPGGLYRGNPDPVNTFGVNAVVTASTHTAAETVYQLVKSVFENLTEFNRLHHVLTHETRASMIDAGGSVPLHAGAKRYFRETGLLSPEQANLNSL